MTNFKIRTFGRTELAQLASGLSPKSRTYTPAQVGLIVGALGEPGEN